MKGFLLKAVMMFYLAGLACALQASPATETKNSNQPTTGNNSSQTGEEVFRTHCARCHVPPTALSPRITGTVVMHMRTRARLSRHDEQLLLRYLAP